MYTREQILTAAKNCFDARERQVFDLTSGRAFRKYNLVVHLLRL